MSEEIWKWDTNRNVITEVMKADSIINKSVRMITFGKQATIKPLRLLEEDFFHNQPILFKDCLMLLGEENVHVVNFNKNMTFLRSWNDEDQNENECDCLEEEDETQASSTSHKGSKEEENNNIENMENVDQQIEQKNVPKAMDGTSRITISDQNPMLEEDDALGSIPKS